MELDNFVRMQERPLHFGSWSEASVSTGNVKEHKAIVNPETEKIVSVVGVGYQLVQNADIFPQYDEAIYMSDLNTNGMTRKVQTSHGGGRTKVEYRFPEHRVAIRDNDEIDLTLTVLNSYDTSWRFRSILGAFRLICTNGMTIGTAFQEYSGKHTLNLDTDRAIKDLAVALESYLANAEVWKEYPNVQITSLQANNIFESLAKGSKALVESLNDSFKGYTYELGYNLWALFNTLTHWSTHTKVRNEANAPSIVVTREDRVRKVLPMLDKLRLVA